MAWINRREGRALLDFERKVAERADLCAFVSEAEAALFRRASGLGPDRIVGVDNGVALDFFDPLADFPAVEIGRAHVWTPVTNANLVCRLLLDKKKKRQRYTTYTNKLT